MPNPFEEPQSFKQKLAMLFQQSVDQDHQAQAKELINTLEEEAADIIAMLLEELAGYRMDAISARARANEYNNSMMQARRKRDLAKREVRNLSYQLQAARKGSEGGPF